MVADGSHNMMGRLYMIGYTLQCTAIPRSIPAVLIWPMQTEKQFSLFDLASHKHSMIIVDAK